MKRTVTALYETRAQAEQVEAALVAAHLGDNVDIREESDTAEGGKSEHHDFGGWLSNLLGGHDDRHVYIEGIRRGHFMLSAKVDELNETRAAEILDAAAPVDLENAQTQWRAEGWAPVDVGREGYASSEPTTPMAKWIGARAYPADEDTLDD